MKNELFLCKDKTIYLDWWRNGYRQKYIKECCNCKEEFDMYPSTPNEWCYKNCLDYSKNYFCSWHCQMEYEKRHKKTR